MNCLYDSGTATKHAAIARGVFHPAMRSLPSGNATGHPKLLSKRCYRARGVFDHAMLWSILSFRAFVRRSSCENAVRAPSIVWPCYRAGLSAAATEHACSLESRLDDLNMCRKKTGSSSTLAVEFVFCCISGRRLKSIHRCYQRFPVRSCYNHYAGTSNCTRWSGLHPCRIC